MRIRIEGHTLPGRNPGGHRDVQVGIQLRRDPVEVVPADVAHAVWEIDVAESYAAGDRDFRGPAVQGKRGERFIYLTWLEGPDATMFRRAKLMLAGAPDAPSVTARVNLTDECGLPRCARLSPPAVEWSEDLG
ncbi:DUF5990 family protein [Nocardioides sp.]|uniref:DUF5990 family protein n=1 Tax=Nocardioides sp. TaxID=35761 RepID=UPI002BE22ECB|nr:DUF5990 family protein [Nocardioides sp.]HXH80796.1 DUF5990 family protein [Nocardioides sp.]